MPQKTSPTHFIAWRFYLLVVIISLFTVGLAARVFCLTILERSFLQKEGNDRILRQINTQALRGMIRDRTGSPLAITTLVYSIWINPQAVPWSRTQDLRALAHLLAIKLAHLQKFTNDKRGFVYLKRGVAPDVTEHIKALKLPGVFAQADYQRFYPEGEVTAHVTGFTDIDDRGIEGVELSFNQWLQGKPGQKWVIKDRLNRAIEEMSVGRLAEPGHDLMLSIDRRLQYVAYKALLQGVQTSQAKSGSVIVLDTKTGEVLALVNYPSYNPNNHSERVAERVRNRAVTDTFEPGSTIKAFSIASALETGLYHPHSVIDTTPGWMQVDHHLVKDPINRGKLNLQQILQVSSNMGVSKMILTLPPNQLGNLLQRIGFGETTNVGLPGEQNGWLLQREPWGAFMRATLSFGYGFSVTAIQLARAYAILANDGVKIPISILKVDQPPIGNEVLPAKLAKQMRELLEAVTLKGGTGTKAQVEGYRVAGKTGTARMVGKGGYQKDRHISSFVGMAPVSQPRLVIAVVLHDAQGKSYTGGAVSAPVFQRIMEDTLRILDVPMDASSH